MPMQTRSRIARLCRSADAHYQCGEYALAAPAYRDAIDFGRRMVGWLLAHKLKQALRPEMWML